MAARFVTSDGNTVVDVVDDLILPGATEPVEAIHIHSHGYHKATVRTEAELRRLVPNWHTLVEGLTMPRRRSTLEQIRRGLYKTQRGIGDFQAAERGPYPLAKRLVRRRVTRSLFRLFR